MVSGSPLSLLAHETGLDLPHARVVRLLQRRPDRSRAKRQKGRLAPAVGSSDSATDKAADGLDIMTQMDDLVPSVELDETSEIFW